MKKRVTKRRVSKRRKCPYCQSLNLYSNGTRRYEIREHEARDSRKFLCRDCGKYFTTHEGVQTIRVVVISDTHCGHVTGLTPPQYEQLNNTTKTKIDKYRQFRRESYEWYKSQLQRLMPIDVLIVNADCIDGRQEKSGSNELLTIDRSKQVDMAVDVIEEAGADQIYMTYGTPFHVGNKEQWEDQVCKLLNKNGTPTKIENHLKLDIGGCIFDVRHKIGRSTIPHGRFTQMAKTSMWNDLMNKTDTKANVIIRSHVHYFIALMHSINRICVTTPALQGDTDFGSKECEGSVDFGFLKFDITDGMISDWKCYTTKIDGGIERIERVKINKKTI